MSVALAVEVSELAPERVTGDLLVTFWWDAQRPPRGAAGRVDWRLCGLLSARIQEGAFEGARGEGALLAAPGRLAAGRALVVSTGARSAPGRTLRAAAAAALGRAARLRAGVVVVALPGERECGLPAARATEAVLQGAADALAERPFPLHLRLAAPRGELGAVATALAQLAREPLAGGVVLRPARPERRDPARQASEAGAHPGPHPPSGSRPVPTT